MVKPQEDFYELAKILHDIHQASPEILEAIQTAQAPSTFSTRFLEKLGFTE